VFDRLSLIDGWNDGTHGAPWPSEEVVNVLVGNESPGPTSGGVGLAIRDHGT
jgi:hypothetical protein